DINVPEYLSMETQQRALSILTATMQRVHKEGSFALDPLSSIASDIVEELISQPDVTIHLTGIATYDDCTLSHSLNCSIYTALLARCCGFSIPQIKVITCGALLHDIGKIEIDKKILNKPDRLVDEEFAIMKQHPMHGFNLLTKKRLEVSSLVAHMAWQHHEKIDGSGYPRGLKGEEILGYARLLSITDVYDAITAHRPYRGAMRPEDAFNIIQSGLGTSFDDTFGQVFLSKIALYTPGSQVILNTGEQAVVVSVPPATPQRPVIRLITYPDGTPCSPPKEISLAENPDISITTIQ
ncbi:MAG: HD-GYP domain-containing protein, partial [Sporomusaceae bacterium]|nr:HD-GYP domain-containing protein [Sporomusaceae bacterium]